MSTDDLLPPVAPRFAPAGLPGPPPTATGVRVLTGVETFARRQPFVNQVESTLPTDAAEPEQCRAGSRMRKPSGVAPGRLFSWLPDGNLQIQNRPMEPSWGRFLWAN